VSRTSNHESFEEWRAPHRSGSRPRSYLGMRAGPWWSKEDCRDTSSSHFSNLLVLHLRWIMANGPMLTHRLLPTAISSSHLRTRHLPSALSDIQIATTDRKGKKRAVPSDSPVTSDPPHPSSDSRQPKRPRKSSSALRYELRSKGEEDLDHSSPIQALLANSSSKGKSKAKSPVRPRKSGGKKMPKKTV
jgi:hypothetical protein